MRQYLLGIDIGTSSCKAAVFDRMGKPLVISSGAYPVYYPAPGFVEQNPLEWWESVCTAVRECLEKGKLRPEEIIGVGVDGQSWSAVAVDKKGETLANTPIWQDTRSEELCTRYRKEIGGERIFHTAGNVLQPFYTTGKILWYREYMPHMYEKIHKILQSNSFIVMKLTGVCSQDISQAYGIHCFNMENGGWDEELCRAFGIPVNILPEISLCSRIVGTVTEWAAAQCGLCPGTPVVAGGVDAACGALGAGVIHGGETQEQGGQAGGMSICCDTFCAHPSLIVSRHVTGDQWLLQGGTTGGGGVMRWIEREFAGLEREHAEKLGKSSLEQLNEEAAAVLPGSGGVVFLPYMAGERTPIWDTHAKGVYYGLDYSKTKACLVRAAMEGVAFSLLHNLDTAEAAGIIAGELHSVGGSANSVLWTQIKADVTGRPVSVSCSDTATALGAAMLAGVGCGVYRNFEEAVHLTSHVKRRQEPNPEFREIYYRNYETYLDLYRRLQPLMDRGKGGEYESSSAIRQ